VQVIILKLLRAPTEQCIGAALNAKPKILFLSTGDATRSQMAEAFLRTFAGDTFDVASAAVNSNSLHPLANDVMKELGIDISGQAAQSVAELFKDRFTCVVTIADAARERHAVFPFTPRLVHWDILDPASAGGSPDQRLEWLRRLRDEIKLQVSQFIAEAGQTGKGGAPIPQQQARAANVNEVTEEDTKEHEG